MSAVLPQAFTTNFVMIRSILDKTIHLDVCNQLEDKTSNYQSNACNIPYDMGEFPALDQIIGGNAGRKYN